MIKSADLRILQKFVTEDRFKITLTNRSLGGRHNTLYSGKLNSQSYSSMTNSERAKWLEVEVFEEFHISPLTQALIAAKSQNIEIFPRNKVENFAVYALHILAMRSAFFSGDNTSSIYQILKNAENLIDDIKTAEKFTLEERGANGKELVTIGDFHYYETQLQSFSMNHALGVYGLLIPSTHVDNLHESQVEILKKIKMTETIPFRVYREGESVHKRLLAFEKKWEKGIEAHETISKANKLLQVIAKKADDKADALDIREKILGKHQSSFTSVLLPQTENPSIIDVKSKLNFSQGVIDAYEGINIALDEMTDLQFAIFYVAALGRNIITRSSNTGERVFQAFGIAVSGKASKEDREDLYKFIEILAIESDFVNPTLKTLIRLFNSNGLNDFDLLMTLQMSSDEDVKINTVKDPMYSRFLKNYFKID